ncbi:gamma-glutamyltransferase [Haladaptatus sp. DYSN1]|uniref:gamma-glutamyltransferase n=1 Tax=unclassified Haladaptatus TaxID=2622732 RepID=UPI00240585CD|nr:gamma-glutamyltransferase [Haladaptatus sp. DYSN1]
MTDENEPSSRSDQSGLSRRTVLKNTALAAGLSAVSLTEGTHVAKGTERDGDQYVSGNVVEAAGGMVSSLHPRASEIGAKVLNDGGNAVDAAVATHYALNVAAPPTCGIGGGGFMIIYSADDDEFTLVDSREAAPAGAEPDMFLGDDGAPIPFDDRHTHGRAVGVPGTAMGLQKALDLHGTRPLAQLITPAMNLAKNGVEVGEVLAEEIANNWWKLNDAAREVFSDECGDPLEAGDLLVQPELAETLRLIKTQGTEAVFEGEIAEGIAQTVQENGGTMTVQDLAEYEVTLDEPTHAEYKDLEVVSQPPPSSGGLMVSEILKIAEERAVGEHDIRDAEKYHILAEAMGLSYADREAHVGDPEFVDVPREGFLADGYIEERAANISMDATLADYEADECVEAGNPWAYQEGDGEPAAEETASSTGGQTSHFTVADAEGNLVSYTTTIEQFFGTGLMVPEYGFMLNNELTDFNAIPGGPNQVEAGKRPMSSMSPTVVMRDGEPDLTVGSPGGSTIICSVIQTILHHYEYGLSVYEAINEPAFYTDECPPIYWEPDFPQEAKADLESLGHVFRDESMVLGNVNCIEVLEDAYRGIADPARDSEAVGVTARGESDD